MFLRIQKQHSLHDFNTIKIMMMFNSDCIKTFFRNMSDIKH